MNRKLVVAIFSGLIIVLGMMFIAFLSNNSVSQEAGTSKGFQAPQTKKKSVSAEKVEIVYFHATRRCPSCVAMGSYSEKTVKERFADEFASGKIVFRQVNVELPKNKEIVTRYQARGSSLFINAIAGGQDSIEEYTDAWRFVSDEKAFVNNFSQEINDALGI